MENSAFPWIHFVIFCVYAVVGIFGILVCRQVGASNDARLKKIKLCTYIIVNITYQHHLIHEHIQRVYSKAKIFTIASWTFVLLALPWDVIDLVMANELQNHAHTHCYNYNEPPDLKTILNFDISCDEIKLAPPVVGVVTIMLLLLKV
jgi:hypothetical protein